VQISVHLPQDLQTFVERTAERESRSVSGQIKHWVVEAARRAGAPPSAGDNPGGYPLLPIVNPKNIDQVRAELSELEAERDKLQAQQDKLGFRFGPESDQRLSFLHSRIGAIKSHVVVVERAMGVRT
jgi:hypothetical protein